MDECFNLVQLPEIAARLIKTSTSKQLLFYGEMGVGKTTLIKEIIQQLGVEDTVSSPTYSLVNVYETNEGSAVYHFDFYRINDEEEALDMGIDEYLDSPHWCFIEWPERIKNLLPLNALEIHLSLEADGKRRIKTN
ncbi:tRNA (adenosine(37)-N6)-threonylcarbamoyltransferase complex ATPase subunit type 1 TsaE [Flavobacteriaceae bacterium F08102]|nr:tRNA (adenosine(37)-N6)-threonylcarbamoyltransferase complex ATPase subunit type 1 TsaE [Flavobacteriaceae bacterium F08102]